MRMHPTPWPHRSAPLKTPPKPIGSAMGLRLRALAWACWLLATMAGWTGLVGAAHAQTQPPEPSTQTAPTVAPDAVQGTVQAVAPDTPHDAAPDRPATADPAPAQAPAQRWQYTLGLKLKSSEQADGRKSLALRPVLGLRYGRWRLGHATGDEWFKFSGYREATNLAYDLRDDDRLHLSLSARIQNIQDNSSFDGFSSGKNTVRGRVSASYQLDKHWSLGSDVTQDLMNRGDGTTLSMGVSYLWPLSERSALSLSSGASWATARHWATQLRLRPTPEGGWQAGLGDWGWGMSYRYAITPQWAWFGTLGTSRHLGQVNEVSPSHFSWNGQLGLLYFSR